MPPSTTSSHTTSAAPSPVCGRASIEFSILTASAGRSTGPCAGTPVRGQSTGGGGGGGVVVGAAALVLLLVRDGSAVRSPDDAHEVRTTASATAPSAARGRRRTG